MRRVVEVKVKVKIGRWRASDAAQTCCVQGTTVIVGSPFIWKDSLYAVFGASLSAGSVVVVSVELACLKRRRRPSISLALIRVASQGPSRNKVHASSVRPAN